jgi:hypothetical protein
MKKYFYLISIILTLFMLMAFLLDSNSLIYRIVNNLISLHPRNFSKIQFLGVVIYLGLGVSFSVGGYYCAKRKNRNIWIWAIACFLWNLWAYLLILCLPSRKSNPAG